MASTLIVLAHPRPNSFNHAWAQASLDASRSEGHEVHLSDLYATGFDPRHADDGAPLAADIAEEIERIRHADRIIFHFPLWWFAPPAILKGWFDRVLAHRELHSSQQRFDTGPCRGKTALFCVTTGSTEAESAPDGKEGDLRLHLWPAAYTLRYCGFDVLQPIAVHDVLNAPSDALKQALTEQARIIREFDTLPRMRFNRDTDFLAGGRLRPDAPSHSPFIRHGEP